MEEKLKGSYSFAWKLKGQMFCNFIKSKSIVPSIPFRSALPLGSSKNFLLTSF